MRTTATAFILLAASVVTSLEAQDASPSPGVFLSAGAGFGSHFTPHVSLTLGHSTGDYILRGAVGFGPDLYLPWGGPRELTEVSVLYGLRKQWGRTWSRAAVGLGRVHGPQLSPVAPGEEPVTSSFGPAAEAGVAWQLRPRIGLGLTGVGNGNGFRSLAAVTLGIHVGGVR
jgi:hypothetical protein